jgi:hypothetical protein
MADKDHVIATERIVDEELQRVVYSPGDRVPMDDALKYGLVKKSAAKKAAKKQAPSKGKRAPAEDRARKPSGNRRK